MVSSPTETRSGPMSVTAAPHHLVPDGEAGQYQTGVAGQLPLPNDVPVPFELLGSEWQLEHGPPIGGVETAPVSQLAEQGFHWRERDGLTVAGRPLRGQR
jgi:hypothetical protein